MRAKKTKSVDVANVELAWANLFASTVVHDVEALRKEGWRGVNEIADQSNRLSNTVSSILTAAVKKGRFECMKVKAESDGKVVVMNLYRPKSKK